MPNNELVFVKQLQNSRVLGAHH